ncbi:DUF3795 domain-containing protein [bacterium]|nr:DUF3795 domain-containing protein [bacterium]
MTTAAFDPNSYCGLYCGACEILNAHRAGLDGGRPAAWDDLPAELRGHIPRAEVVCRGCRTDTVFAGCRGCHIRDCARARGVDACVTCPDFPCAEVERLRALVAQVGDRLPHARAIFRDAELAQQQGLAAWAEAQRVRWNCPSCGAPFTWYQARCRGCGGALKSARGY